jgi:ribosomal protein S10
MHIAIFVFFSTLDLFDSSQGTNTFDRYEMRIYKRVIDFDTSVETIRTLVRHFYARVALAMHANLTICSC